MVFRSRYFDSALLCPRAYDAIKMTLSKPKLFINSTTLIGGQCRS
jgi:hypothetical protein